MESSNDTIGSAVVIGKRTYLFIFFMLFIFIYVVYLFVYGLVNDAVSNSFYTAYGDR